MNDKRERSIFKNSFSCFMTDRSATEQEVNNILSHDISHDLKSLKCFKFIQFSDVCLEEIYHIEKKLNIHFDGHNSSTNEPFTIFILRCVFQFY